MSLSRRLFFPSLPMISLLVCASVVAPRRLRGDDWTFDVLHLKNGKDFSGLILAESPSSIRFRCVRRTPGSPTVLITNTFARDEVARIERLDASARVLLVGRLKALDPSGKGEEARMENLDLKPVRWPHGPSADALQYASTHFVLISNAREDIVRRAAVRLEQIYTAFGRYLPPRQGSGKPTTIYLFRALPEYHTLLKSQNRDLLNPALYDATRNQILCASDLERLGDELERLRKKHQEILRGVDENEKELNKYYKSRIPPAVRESLDKKRQEVERANRKNDGVFKDATRHLFRTLYHEAFHAYLANFVYPPDEYDVPRWLNEGLAQIFETAIVESGELRVGHADPLRLDRIKTLVRKHQLLRLPDLLQAGAKQFFVNHANDQQISDAYYLNSWALAFDLTFDRHTLGTPALDRYVRALKSGREPIGAFQEFIGEPIERFEPAFHRYLRSLRSDGTVGR